MGNTKEGIDFLIIKQRRKSPIALVNTSHKKVYIGNWLLTEYEKKNDVISASSSDNETEPGGQQVDTAPLPNNVIPGNKDMLKNI